VFEFAGRAARKKYEFVARKRAVVEKGHGHFDRNAGVEASGSGRRNATRRREDAKTRRREDAKLEVRSAKSKMRIARSEVRSARLKLKK
jgi:hypothetical protein